jgi:hypothetical protein
MTDTTDQRCRNQGAPFTERACGCCHEGVCSPDSFIVLRRFDVEALLEEWGDLDSDPFWKPIDPKSACVAMRPDLPEIKLAAAEAENRRLRDLLETLTGDPTP